MVPNAVLAPIVLQNIFFYVYTVLEQHVDDRIQIFGWTIPLNQYFGDTVWSKSLRPLVKMLMFCMFLI